MPEPQPDFSFEYWPSPQRKLSFEKYSDEPLEKIEGDLARWLIAYRYQPPKWWQWWRRKEPKPSANVMKLLSENQR